MNSTVTRLMEVFADEYAAAAHNYFSSRNSRPEWEQMVAKRKALEAELTRLFTPLTDDQLAQIDIDFYGSRKSASDVALHVERLHGIGGES